MEKNNKQLIILCVIILLFLVMLFSAVLKRRAKPSSTKIGVPLKVTQQKTEDRLKSRSSAFNNWGRDPFAVGEKAIEVSGDFILTGIIWDAARPYCIINGRVIKEGDSVLNARVLKIEKDNVSIAVGNQVRVLRVGQK